MLEEEKKIKKLVYVAEDESDTKIGHKSISFPTCSVLEALSTLGSSSGIPQVDRGFQPCSVDSDGYM